MNEFEEFRSLVRRMRDAQKKYFATRDRNWLVESKGLESKVDDMLVYFLVYYGDEGAPDKN